MEPLKMTLSERIEKELEKNLQDSLKNPEFASLVKRLKISKELAK